jgi:hypothetical protein
MRDVFSTAAGSVQGRDYRGKEKNNQDAYYVYCGEKFITGTVADGCGTYQHSEIGSMLGCRYITEAISRRVPSLVEEPTDREDSLRNLMREVKTEVLGHIAANISAMGGGSIEKYSDTAFNYFLFTCVGFVVTPLVTFTFSIGDGYIILNGETVALGPFPDNAPPYLVYNLLSSPSLPAKEMLDFTLNFIVPTEEVQSLLISTDGLRDLISAEKENIPGQQQEVGPISQFWTSDKFFSNPVGLQRRLNLINRDFKTIDYAGQRVKTESGWLSDDTTIIVMRKIPSP